MSILKFKPGDKVWVCGKSYQSANGRLSFGIVEKQADEIKRVAPNGAHPYTLKNTKGWFNTESIEKYVELTVKIGDNVKLIKAETYNLIPIKLSPNIIYKIIDIKEKKAYINYDKYNFTVNVYNLKKV